MNLTVNPMNDPPVAVNDSGSTNEDAAVTITAATLLSNDTDIDGDTLSVTSVQGATHGTVALVGGDAVFTPTANYNGPASFTYTISDGNGGTSTATVNLTVNPMNDPPTITTDDGVVGGNDLVYESGLATGSSPSAITKVAEGTFTVSDADGLGNIKSIAFTSTGTSDTTLTIGSGGIVDLAGMVEKTFTTSNGTVELTSYNGSGQFGYKFTLTSPTTDATGTETNHFTVTVSDAAPSTASATVTIDIVDDKPIANSNHADVGGGSVSSSKVNILLVLDMSASMQGTNLTALKAATSAMVDAYDAKGGFNMEIVTFGGSAKDNGIFHNATEVKTFLNGIANTTAAIDVYGPGSGTNYVAAVAGAQTYWTTAKATLTGETASNSVAYFISDGVPDAALTTTQRTTWESYVTSNFTKAIAIGIGASAPADTDLQAVAFTPGGGADTILIASTTDNSALTSALLSTLSTVPGTASGNLLTDTVADVAGADGSLALFSATYGADVYLFSPTNTNHTFHTNVGDVLVNRDGSYLVTGKADLTAGVTGSLSYTVEDADHSQSTAQLTMNEGIIKMGTASGELLSGSAYNDLLYGAAGDDTLTGSTGADVFKWSLGDQGATTPASDHITDFTVSQGDAIDLRDLLQGEHIGATTLAADIGKFLQFNVESGKLVLNVDHDGGSSFGITEKVIFDNFSTKDGLATALGLATGSSDADIIHKMITNGNLKTDA